MPWSVLVQGGAIGLFLLAGLAHPRVREGIFIPDTFLNVLTGAALFAVRVAVLAPLEALVGGGFFSAAELPVWGQALMTFLALDIMRYWLHRAHHRVGFLWLFHRVHHSSEHINATSGLRMHVVDLVQLTALPLLVFHVFFDHATLAPGVVVGVLLVGAVMDAFSHANIAMDMTKPWNRAWNLLLNNPHFHAWHHTRDGHLRDGNYSNTLIIWDRLFGTEVTQPTPPDAYGVPPDQALVNSLLGMQLLRARPEDQAGSGISAT